MTGSTKNYDRVVDLVWARSLEKIMKGDGPAPVRNEIGDNIDTFIPQIATGMLLGVNPAFARVLYTAALSSAKRNSFFAMRRLGMPSDFFWKFELWSDDKAQSTVSKVVDRIFKALLHAGRRGLLEFLSVDVPATRFTIEFADCAECYGVNAERTACYFHAGTFAGIFSAMLDRDLECVETECVAAGAQSCKFTIGLPTDREVAVPFEENMTDVSVKIDHQNRVDPSADSDRRMVDIGYYQLLLSSAISGNLSTLEKGCFETGVTAGKQLGEILEKRPEGVTDQTICTLYQQLRYTDLSIDSSSQNGVSVTTNNAPESAGFLSDSAFVPFLAGELQTLLTMAGHRVRYSTSENKSDNEVMNLIFVPEV